MDQLMLFGSRLTSLTGMTRHARSWLAYLVTVDALVWLLSNRMFGSVIAMLQQARILPFLLALALIPVLQWLRAWRFSMLLNADQDRSPGRC